MPQTADRIITPIADGLEIVLQQHGLNNQWLFQVRTADGSILIERANYRTKGFAKIAAEESVDEILAARKELALIEQALSRMPERYKLSIGEQLDKANDRLNPDSE